jgi:hypothetical protein
VTDEQRDEQAEETEAELVAAGAENDDAEPDFELHGQYFDTPSE